MNKIRLCEYCKKPFSVPEWRIRRYNVRCCSRACLTYVTRPAREEKRLTAIKSKPAHNNAQVSITCKVCGKEFLVSPSRKGIRKYCSDACMRKAQTKPQKHPSKYVRIYVNGVRVHEHRYVMEQILGRPLQDDEEVHHINEDKTDNRPENLQVVSKKEHAKITFSYRKL